MPTPNNTLAGLRTASLDKSPVSLGPRRTASPHEFYRYPAKFSPAFAAAAIEAFTLPGDLILDPFVGGGTTAVEAQRLDRRVIASDLNPLAAFVTSVKTTLLTRDQQAAVSAWLSGIPSIRLSHPEPDARPWDEGGYFKDLQTPETWRLRKVIGLMLSELPSDAIAEDFARCVVLRAAQWALDMRSTLPSAGEFRRAVKAVGTDMLEVAEACATHLAGRPVPRVLCQGVPGLASVLDLSEPPRLVLTSPPYPGVYVNYHRWKMLGRREIRAPYWITNNFDGHGLAHYTMGARADRSLDTYFQRLFEAFRDVAQLFGPDTVVVQMVGFNDRRTQLPRYLLAMEEAGLAEVTDSRLATDSDGRLWRAVPWRRWWTTASTRREVAPHTAEEVVLLHRLET
jgi:hypothetical protein